MRYPLLLTRSITGELIGLAITASTSAAASCNAVKGTPSLICKSSMLPSYASSPGMFTKSTTLSGKLYPQGDLSLRGINVVVVLS